MLNTTTTDQVRVVLAEDHTILREGLRRLLDAQDDISVIGEANNGRSAVDLVKELTPDVVVMDVGMPELNGIEATRQLRAASAGTRVLALSMHKDRRVTTEMLRAGARGYVVKDAAFQELANAVREVVAGRVYISPVVAGTLLDGLTEGKDVESETRSAFATLSPREREVLQLMAEGRSTKEIARDLGVSVKTVETHRRQMMEKLQLFSVAELTKYAIREGVTTLQ